MAQFRVLDLFSGGGGMSCGFAAHPAFQIVGAVDAENGKPSSGSGSLECNSTYSRNMGVTPLKADLGIISPNQIAEYLELDSGSSEIDVLISCAPCTGFSRTVRKSLIVDDTRNSLVQRTSIFVEHFRPKIFVMENVGELLEGNFRHHFDFLSSYLSNIGYKCVADVHNLRQFGLPQRRRRACVVGVSRNLTPHSLMDLWGPYSVCENATTVRRAIGHLPPLEAGQQSDSDPFHASPGLSETSLERLRRIPGNGGSWPDLLKSPDGERYLIPSMRFYSDQGKVGPYRDVYGRLAWDQPAVTIKRECSHVGNGRYSHPEQHRLCSVRELALLQGFPANYEFAGSLSNMYRHIGDAVPPLISYQLAHICNWILAGRKPELDEVILNGSQIDSSDIIISTQASRQLVLEIL